MNLVNPGNPVNPVNSAPARRARQIAQAALALTLAGVQFSVAIAQIFLADFGDAPVAARAEAARWARADAETPTGDRVEIEI